MHSVKQPPVPDTLDLCCGGKKCPVFKDDGQGIIVSDLEQGSQTIRLTYEQAALLAPWMEARLDQLQLQLQLKTGG